MEKISVAVRLRPSKNDDVSPGSFWKVEDNQISLHKSADTASSLSFAFDHVFDEESTNARVYELLIKDIITAAVQGFNGTAFAYGQTSSGKTFTMNGSESDPGIIHQAVKDIFGNIRMVTDREFLIRVSYMEIYNEEINDLFSVENNKLPIHESLERGIFVAGLREEIVNSAEQVFELIQSGEVNRHFGETNMNVRSSRSHTIFRMVIESKGIDSSSNFDDAIRVSVLNLVDLAGSERIAKTGAGGVRLKEGKYINKSLMVLGNVINKLSDSTKQRGHIPYRDSKLTRILQPALGGNAKTSIICTVAPEEVHIEETKGTLQFASRAKRITNRVQVNEILTDAALLKRQKLEIEELRNKLQYELEREKLAMELEEERKSHRERDQCIKEQEVSVKQKLTEESSVNHTMGKEDIFSTPALKPVPSAFVVKRSHQLRRSEFSPLPNTFGDIADEDTWLQMNKGFVADLDSLHITPARKDPSFPASDGASNCSSDIYEEQIKSLQRQLKLATEERDELERQQKDQMLLNSRLMQEVSELQQEAAIIREIPKRLQESVTNCKNVYKDALSICQNSVADESLPTAKLLSSACEIGSILLSTLETHFSVATDSHDTSLGSNLSVQEQCNMLRERLVNTVTSLGSSEAPIVKDECTKNSLHGCISKEFSLGEEITSWKENMNNEVTSIQEKYHSLEKKLEISNQLLDETKERYHTLENEFYLLTEERVSLLQTASGSSQRLAMVTDQKDKILQDLKSELKRRKHLEEVIKEFSAEFLCQHRSRVSFHTEFKSIVENSKAQKSIPKSLGY
uniref:Kinesin-like protein n=1 Tax=Daucus carota subsp. sativus TaxID=79200 RepID=A0A164X1L4_DAUCS